MLGPGDVTGVILVGGKSSRMGRDKALLPLDGMYLLDKVLETMKSCLQHILLVGDYAERFKRYGLPEELGSIDGHERAFLNVNTIGDYEAILGRKNHDR